jgi:glycosyltransferase involved in cell wall biosynthesis
MRGARPAGRPDVSIVSSGHDVADARLHRIVTAIQRTGASVEVLGLGDPRGAPEGCPVRTWERGTMVRRAFLAGRRALAARGRCLYSPDPDALVANRVVGALTGRPVVADVHEDYLRLLRDRSWATGAAGHVARLVVHLANRAAATASLTLVADAHVRPTTARHRLVVRNEADARLVGPPADPDPAPRAVYVGDVRRSRGLFTMLDALAAAPGWTLDVVGPVAAADRSAIDARMAQSPELASRIRWHGRLAPHRTWEVARGSWVGLALLDDTPAFREAVPSKLYEYIQAGLVPLVSDLPRQREVATDAGGIVVRDAEGAARELRLLSANPEMARALRRRVLEHSALVGSGGSAYDEAAREIVGLIRG